MRLLLLVALASFTLAAPALAGVPTGSWSQTSDGQELTLVPRLKISPSMSATGMVLGTSGYGGNSTTTTLQSEFVPMRTQRAMSLVIRPDGGFTWTIDKSRPVSVQSADCNLLIREEKSGRVRVEGDRLVFDVAGGVQSSRDSCDAAKTSSGPKAAASESYGYRLSGGTLNLTAAGGVNWTFRGG